MVGRAGRVHAVKAGPRARAVMDGRGASSARVKAVFSGPRADRGATATVHGPVSNALSFQRICREGPSPLTFLREKLQQRPVEDLRGL